MRTQRFACPANNEFRAQSNVVLKPPAGRPLHKNGGGPCQKPKAQHKADEKFHRLAHDHNHLSTPSSLRQRKSVAIQLHSLESRMVICEIAAVENQVGRGLMQIRQDGFERSSIPADVRQDCDAHRGILARHRTKENAVVLGWSANRKESSSVRLAHHPATIAESERKASLGT